MDQSMLTRSTRVPAHRACNGCGYDLFGQPLDGRCPECGWKVRGTYRGPRVPKPPKNPRRQAAQFRRWVKRDRADLMFAPLFWIVPLIILGVCVVRDAAVGWYVGAGIAAVLGGLVHWATISQARERRRRLAEIESRIAAEDDRND